MRKEFHKILSRKESEVKKIAIALAICLMVAMAVSVVYVAAVKIDLANYG